MRLDTFRHHVNKTEERLTARKAERAILLKQKKQIEDSSKDTIDKKLHLEKVSALLVKTAEQSREAGRQRMEKVVTRALQYVFGPTFTFEIEMDESGGKPVARFLVCSVGEDGSIVKNEPQDSRGGGINDIVAAALQVATMVIYNEPKIQGAILLDEPGKHISDEYVVKFGEFLRFVSKTFGRQINMVTHQPHLAQTADKCLVSQLVGGKTVITEYIGDDELFDWADEEE